MKQLLALLILYGCLWASTESISVKSPSESISIEITFINNNPVYSVYYLQTKIIENSGFGFLFKGQALLKHDLQITDIKRRSFDETWENLWGERKFIRNNFNELRLELTEKNSLKRKLYWTFRVYDDGLGFRFEFPEQQNLNELILLDEIIEMRFTADHNTWWIPADHDSYEYLYNNTRLSGIDSSPYNYNQSADRYIANMKAVNTPITMKTDDGIYISIHEAALYDYADMTLALQDNLKLVSELVPWADGAKVKTKTPFQTPWRTIQLSETAGGLIESNLIVNLNEPNKLKDVSWIEPMKYIGIWWEMHIGKSSWGLGVSPESWSFKNTTNHGANTANAKMHIDFASDYGIKGILIEGWNTGWEYWGLDTIGFFDFITPYPDFDILEVINYAKSKGVEIIGHHETSGQADNYESRLHDAFKFYKGLGIRAVKTGYAGGITPKGERHHGQYMVRHYQKVVETAAQYGIMINAHEPIKDTGIRRTFPNFMTREGARGMEWNAWSEGNPPDHTTIMPFTRCLAGPFDYTPGIFDLTFDKYKEKERVQSTLANQLALYVVLYSPMQMAADLPENYLNHPAFEFIQSVEVDFDETIILNGEIGDFITVAREKNDEWFIGSINDENPRTIKINFDFLDKDKTYSAKIFKDAPETNYLTNPGKVVIETITVAAGDSIEVILSAAGGFAAVLKPI